MYCLLSQVLGASSSVIDFIATHPYPVYGWDYMDYVAGKASNLQACSRSFTFCHEQWVESTCTVLKWV